MDPPRVQLKYSVNLVHSTRFDLQKLKSGEVKPEAKRKPFNREEDLQVNKFDDAQKKQLIKKSQLLNSRFSHGGTGTQFLWEHHPPSGETDDSNVSIIYRQTIENRLLQPKDGWIAYGTYKQWAKSKNSKQWHSAIVHNFQQNIRL